MGLSEDQKEFVIDHLSRAEFDVSELRHLFADSDRFEFRPSEQELEEYVSSDRCREQVEVRRSVREKRAQVAQEDLVETLVTLKDDLEDWHVELKDTHAGDVRNDLISNIMTAVERIGELQGELQREGTARNEVKIADVDVSNVVGRLPESKQVEVAEALEGSDAVSLQRVE